MVESIIITYYESKYAWFLQTVTNYGDKMWSAEKWILKVKNNFLWHRIHHVYKQHIGLVLKYQNKHIKAEKELKI